jgi:aspartate aminotransferase
MAIARHIGQTVASSSFIRKMFETGIKLKAEHGADKVFDFSLGNPSLPPPAAFTAALRKLSVDDFAGKHAYMPNAGYPDVRAAVAEWVGKAQGIDLPSANVVMSCGAGGGLNVVFKTLLNPGDEVIASLPCFMEYNFYAQNHGGALKTVPCRDDFDLDLDAIAAAITPQTAIVMVNSPNNPSGAIYSESSLAGLAAVLAEAAKKHGRTIYLVADEPYRAITYDRAVPPLMRLYPHSIVVSSFSKELSIPGERIGWIAVNPAAEDAAPLLDGATVCTRILGYVNAPALMQKVIASCLGASADMAAYRRKRDLLCPALRGMGYELVEPAGTFYAFPKVPRRRGETGVGDDLAFVDRLQKELVLAVPGRGFGMPGYFRIAFCVDDSTITRALPGFAAAIKDYL